MGWDAVLLLLFGSVQFCLCYILWDDVSLGGLVWFGDEALQELNE